MSGFVQALRAYRDGILSRDKLLTEVERQLAMRETDAVALMRVLNEEHARAQIPDDVHGVLATRIMSWCSPQAPGPVTESDAPEGDPRADGPDTVVISHDPASAPGVAGSTTPPDVGNRRPVPITLGSVLQGRFKLVESIGQGGMSAVYKAIDLRKVEARSPDPYVAVKLLTIPSSGFGQSLALLQNEAHKLQSLPHPNIVRVIDCDRDGRTVFMTMEYLNGEPLKRKLMAPDFRGMSTEEAEAVIKSIASALEFAHRNGIIHGDLKPGNIIMTERGELKVIDFGIARVMTRQHGSALDSLAASAVERPLLAALTPLYASPEMLEQRNPDPRDDVYALACIAHELLTGLHPFEEKSAVEARDAGMRPVRHRTFTRNQYKAIVHGLEFERERRTLTASEFFEEFRTRYRRPVERTLWVAGTCVIALWGAYFLVRGRFEDRVPTSAITQAPSLAAGEVFRDCPTCPLMKVLPAGEFLQGSAADDPEAQPFEQPQHPVKIGYAFSMGVYEVTVGEFREFVESTSRQITGCTVYDGTWRERPDLSWSDVGYPQTAAHPVACVSWRDAQDYTTWLSHKTGQHYRLPSASEWEYAARAGSAASRPWSGNIESACADANVADESAGQRFPGWKVHPCNDGYVYSAPVGSFAPNGFGLYDMLGNVWEWTQDCWHADYRGSPSDGSAWVSGNCKERDLRGGSWFTTPAYVSVAARNHFQDDYHSNSIGFRLVRELE